MGGREHTQGGREGRPATRRAVLLMAFGVLAGLLVGALFLCARPGAAAEVRAAAGEPGEPGGHAARTGHAAQEGHATRAGHAAQAGLATQAGHATHVVCLSPDEAPGCSGLSHLTPGVLPAPPPAVAVGRTGPAPDARPARPPRSRPAGTLARAPDLHALQVLRT